MSAHRDSHTLPRAPIRRSAVGRSPHPLLDGSALAEQLAEQARTDAARRAESERAALDGAREAIDWVALEPRGAYARIGRPIFLGALVVLGLPFALLLAAIVAPINAIQFRSLRRVFFLQPRVGRRGEVFHIWKFRTMREASRGSHASWSSGEDALRVTRFGRFLRSSHLDELPQVWNVLRGDMSLIGPRPEMIEVESWAAEHAPGFAERLVIRPGLTGLAQITQGYTGNDAAAYAEKLAINREYLATLSFANDARIVLGTIAWMLRGRGWTSFGAKRSQSSSN